MNKENTMKAYLGDTKLKTRFVKEIKKHQEADQLIQGTYGKENGTWKGCAVACSPGVMVAENQGRRTAIYEYEAKVEELFDEHK